MKPIYSYFITIGYCVYAIMLYEWSEGSSVGYQSASI